MEVDLTCREDRRTYIRGLLYIMCKAFDDCYPEIKVKVEYSLYDSVYCTLHETEVTVEMIQKVKSRMKEIVQKDIEIKKVVMSKEEARDFYEKEKSVNGRLQMIDVKQQEQIILYYCEDYYNYFYGKMPKRTGCIDIFDLSKYNEGFLVRYPSKDMPDTLEEYQETRKLLQTFQEYEDINKILGVNTIANLNEFTKEGKAEELILIAEALHEKKIAEIANKIKNNQKRVILIAGPSSSGKTTFAQRLGVQLKLNRINPVTLSADNYFLERDESPKDEFGNFDFESLYAMDLELFNKQIVEILEGKEVKIPTFNFQSGKKEYLGDTVKLQENEVLIVEGIHCLNPKFTEKIKEAEKFRIYVSALTVLNVDYYNKISTTDTRIIRRMVRDSKYRGTKAKDTLKKWYSISRGEEKNIFPFQENADVMFNSSLVYELAALKEQALPLLLEIKKEDAEYEEAMRLADFISYFETADTEYIPRNSIVREFIGGGCFYR